MKTLSLIAGAAVLGLAACAPIDNGGVPPAMDETPNQCRATDYEYLIGKNRSEIPQTPAGAVWRVVCDTCAMTMDYNPRRLNIVYDTETEVVERVSCG